VTSAEALVRRTILPSELAARGTTIKTGDSIDRDELAALLVAGGWTRMPVADEPGTFAVRGEVVDVSAPLAPHPIRIELFGDTVESLRWFDAETQRTLRPVPVLHLHPVRETITTGSRDLRTRLAVRRRIREGDASQSAARAGEVFVGIGPDARVSRRHGRAPRVRASRSIAGSSSTQMRRRVVRDVWADAEMRADELRASCSRSSATSCNDFNEGGGSCYRRSRSEARAMPCGCASTSTICASSSKSSSTRARSAIPSTSSRCSSA
jgi:hypothetical protein